MASIMIGTGVTTTQTFINSSGAETDPTTVTVVIREPDGTKLTFVYLTDVEVVRDSAGVFHLSFVPDQVGAYGIRWVGTGTVAYAEETFFEVEASRVL